MKFSEYLKERVETDKTVSYAKIAKNTDLSQSYLFYIANGRTLPSREVIVKVSDYLGVDPEVFDEFRLRVLEDKIRKDNDFVNRAYFGEISRSEGPRSASARRNKMLNYERSLKNSSSKIAAEYVLIAPDIAKERSAKKKPSTKKAAAAKKPASKK